MQKNPGLIDYMTLPVLKEVRALRRQHAAGMRCILCNRRVACVVLLVGCIIYDLIIVLSACGWLVQP